MKKFINTLASYKNEEWLFVKIPFALIVLVFLFKVLFFSKAADYPLSICMVLDCNVFLIKPIAIILFIISCFASLLYILEKAMLPVLFVLSIISLITFSTSDSSGIFDRYDILTTIYIAQLVAYLYASISKNGKKYIVKNRFQFPIQIIAVSYTLSALSKLYHSGLAWCFSYEGLAIQAKKAIGYKYLINGNEKLLSKLEIFPNFILNHPILVIAILSFSLFAEGFSVVAVLNKKYAFIWGFLLLLMHIGIHFFMNVMVLTISLSMFLFFVNPFYMMYVLIFKYED